MVSVGHTHRHIRRRHFGVSIGMAALVLCFGATSPFAQTGGTESSPHPTPAADANNAKPPPSMLESQKEPGAPGAIELGRDAPGAPPKDPSDGSKSEDVQGIAADRLFLAATSGIGLAVGVAVMIPLLIYVAPFWFPNIGGIVPARGGFGGETPLFAVGLLSIVGLTGVGVLGTLGTATGAGIGRWMQSKSMFPLAAALGTGVAVGGVATAIFAGSLFAPEPYPLQARFIGFAVGAGLIFAMGPASYVAVLVNEAVEGE